MKAGGPTLRLTPFAAQALSLEEEHQLAKRCVDLHCRMSVVAARPGYWTVRLESWARDDRGNPLYHLDGFGLVGHLADLMEGMLDRCERETRYTPEEILIIANQSGLVR